MSGTVHFKFSTVRNLIDQGILFPPLDGNHGEIHPTTADYVSSGIPFIMASDIDNGRIDYVGCKFISRKHADTLRKGFAKNGDVLLTHKATIGKTAVVNYADEPYVMLTPQVTYYRVKNPEQLNNLYLRYFFDSSFFQQLLHLWAGSGSTRAYLGITEQAKLPIVVPPIETQKKIAAILSTYDDLIANNQRRITLLERMAEDIYREWFVRLRFPGHENVKVEKGVPQGWGFVELNELASINGASLKKGSDTARIKYIDISAVSTNYIDDVLEIALADAPGRARRLVKHGDVIWSSVRPANRAYCLIYEPPKNLVASTGFAVISPKQGIPFTFINFAVTSDSFVEQMAMVAKGSAYPATSFDDFGRAMVLRPSPELLMRFHTQCELMFKRRHQLRNPNAALAKQRDSLLPRLISGKLAVDALDIRFPPRMLASD